MNKKAAMFGLDARVALAIFGALSVITGVVLYKAIQKTKTVAFHQEFVEIEKAIEAYILDTGQDIPVTTSVPQQGTFLDIDELFKSSAANWKGAYLENKIDKSGPDDYYRSWPNYIASNSNLFISYETESLGDCNVGTDICYYWIQINNIPSDIGKKVDLYVDSTDDRSNGKLTYYFQSATDFVHVRYKTNIPLLNQQ
ncbi:MAG: type II secretion system protein [Proteobacteria bacterium]|nr:type II secretion system protein [Pseudomonadota bacterium]